MITQNINLKKGWNILSFYVEFDIQFLLNQDFVLEMKNLENTYNSEVETIYNSLTTLDLTMGYLLKSSKDVFFSISGSEIFFMNVPIKAGWNLIPYPNSEQRTLDSITNEYILEIRGDDLTYNSEVDSIYNDLVNILPGSGYWLKSSADFILNFSNPCIYYEDNTYYVSCHLTITQEESKWKINDMFMYDISQNINQHSEFPIVLGPNQTFDGGRWNINIDGVDNWGGLVIDNGDTTIKTVKNVGILNGSVTNTAFISSSCSNLNIYNCYSTGNILGAGGGIITDAKNCTITNCYSTGNIGEKGGGIVGSSSFLCDISNCHSSGHIFSKGGGNYGCFGRNEFFNGW